MTTPKPIFSLFAGATCKIDLVSPTNVDGQDSSQSEFLWYAQKALENGWSRNVLVHQIEIKLYERQASEAKISNFERTLNPPQNELVKEMQKKTVYF